MIPSLEESKWPNSSLYKTKMPFALPLATRGLMRRALLTTALTLCALPALAQTPVPGGAAANPMSPNRHAPQRRPPAPNQLPTLAEVPPTTPVATVKGVCKPAEKTENQECKTVLLRAEMDRIVSLLAPTAAHASPQQIAVNYVRILAAASLGQAHNLENDPAVAKDLEGLERFPRQQVLAQAFYKQVQEQASNPPMTEMQQYYAEHPLQFEVGEVWRLSIPKSSVRRGGGRTLLNDVLDGLHRQAVLGFDFDQLQQQAYKDLNINQVPPATKLTAARRSSLPPDQADVFDLQPGEVSRVIDSYTSLVILKLVSKRMAPFDSVEPEIREELKQAIIEKELHGASQRVTAEFNLKYIGTSTQPTLFPPSGISPVFFQSTTPSDPRKRASSHPNTPTGPAPLPTPSQSNR